ncbi:hypothetical protein NW757_012231 [Fusarium falciforme]|nr:hypothetical protein NW757_012231 [Fusarium falciforme]
MVNRGQTWDPKVHTIADLQQLGSAKLPKIYRDYYNEGAMDLITLKDNEEAYNRYKIRPRILSNVDNIDISGDIFGCKTALPLGFAPSAMHRLAHPEGELATSRAAATYGLCMCLSSYSTESLENVAAQGVGNPYVMQVCMLRDQQTMVQILERAEAAGYKAIFLSVDTPCLGRRLNEYRNNFTLPDGLEWPNLLSNGRDELGSLEDNPEAPSKHDYDPSIDWNSTIPWLRKHTKMEIWIKGVSSADDVVLAIRHGLDGIIISNHGGRQLDGVPATLNVLRKCAVAANGKIPNIMDGGIRRGTDIFKALALGASYVFVGRIPIWGLAYNGQEGIELALKILMYEFKTAMALARCRIIKDITGGYVVYLNSNGVLAKL